MEMTLKQEMAALKAEKEKIIKEPNSEILR